MKVAFDALWASVIRTAVPIAVAAVMGWLAYLGIEPDTELEVLLGSAIGAVLGALYHVAVRLLETHVSPKLGWLLGSPKQPLLYAKPDVRGVPVITNVSDRPGSTVVTISKGASGGVA